MRVRRRSAKRAVAAIFVTIATLTVAAACGLDLSGGPSADLDESGGNLDGLAREGDELASSSSGSSGNTAETGAEDADANVPCTDGGGFCDFCDKTLILCLPFEGNVDDKSPSSQRVTLTGTAVYIPGARGQGQAIDLDGSVTLRVADGPPWHAGSQLTIEMWIRPFQRPPDGGRAGLVDKNGSFGFFLQPNNDLTCTPGAERGALGDAGRFTHVACVIADGKTTLYARGVEIAADDAAGILVPSTEVVALGSNSPSGDPFSGGIDGLRIYARAKTPEEIAATAAFDGGADGAPL
jgi:hypothetical protein